MNFLCKLFFFLQSPFFITGLTTKCQCCPHIESSQLICIVNQFTGFYMRATLALNGLNPSISFDFVHYFLFTSKYNANMLAPFELKLNHKITWAWNQKILISGSSYLLLKSTPMQIWKSPYMFLFIKKYYPENFAFLILGPLDLYTRKICKNICLQIYRNNRIC